MDAQEIDLKMTQQQAGEHLRVLQGCRPFLECFALGQDGEWRFTTSRRAAYAVLKELSAGPVVVIYGRDSFKPLKPKRMR